MFYLVLINGRPRSKSAFGLFAATARQETLFVMIYTRQETLFVIIYTRQETLFVIIYTRHETLSVMIYTRQETLFVMIYMYTNTDYQATNVNDRPYNWISGSFIYLAYTDHSK